jgi:signal transduction histidine kinase
MADAPRSGPSESGALARAAADGGPRPWALLNPLLTFLAALLTIVLVTRAIGARWSYEPLHSAMEAAGGMLALATAGLLIWGRELHDRPYLDWVVAGLIIQGVLDLVHAGVPPGPTFYWSRALPTVLGGVLFALVWAPVEPVRRRALYAGALGLAVLLGVALVAAPGIWPRAFSAGGHYTTWAKLVNSCSGLAYLASALFFLREQQRNASFADGVFASHALLLALASGAFGLSSLWDGTWWAFHAVRLMAYVVSLGYIADLLRRVARRRSEAALEAERAKLESLVMQAPVPMAVYEGPECRLSLVNDAGAVLASRRSLGVPLLEASPEQREAPSLEAIFATYRTGQPHTLGEHATTVRKPDGSLQELSLVSSFVPLRDAEHRVVGVLAAAIDVSEQVRARQAVETSLRFAEQFIGMLGHDLRNPLNAIQMAATLLRETAQGRDARVIERLLSSTKRLSTMVGQLLDLTRARLGGGIAVVRKRTSLAELVDTVADELLRIHPGREILRRLAPDAVGEWDPDRLVQVVSNLIGNALEYGDPARPVEVRLRAEGDHARLEVHSHGPVIPPDLLPVIFDPYRRSDARSLRSQGLGLGLYVTQQIVLAHGGRIDVRSTEAEGTIFEVTLPRVAGPAGALLPSPA